MATLLPRRSAPFLQLRGAETPHSMVLLQSRGCPGDCPSCYLQYPPPAYHTLQPYLRLQKYPGCLILALSTSPGLLAAGNTEQGRAGVGWGGGKAHQGTRRSRVTVGGVGIGPDTAGRASGGCKEQGLGAVSCSTGAWQVKCRAGENRRHFKCPTFCPGGYKRAVCPPAYLFLFT